MTPAAKAPKVLLVEDSDVYRAMLRVYLNDLGAEVLEANDGDVALKLLEHHDVEVVVADLNMERVGGLELLSAIRLHARDKVRKARFVLMTAEDTHTEHFAQAEHSKVDAFVVKPVKPRTFREVVQKLLLGPDLGL